MRAIRAQKRTGGSALLSRALVKRMHRLGVNPERYLTAAPVSLGDYRDLERRLAAKVRRVEWQSSGIKGLQDELATLKALLATQPAMQDTEILKRIAQVEAEQALLRAELVVGEPQETNLDAVHRLAYTLHPEWQRRGREGAGPEAQDADGN